LLFTALSPSHIDTLSLHDALPISLKYLAFSPEEHPISAQLFGADPAVMAVAARICQDLGFDVLDINFGCPVSKVTKCNGGSGCIDRKSTRLNSSHVSISYAVFCLK